MDLFRRGPYPAARAHALALVHTAQVERPVAVDRRAIGIDEQAALARLRGRKRVLMAQWDGPPECEHALARVRLERRQRVVPERAAG